MKTRFVAILMAALFFVTCGGEKKGGGGGGGAAAGDTLVIELKSSPTNLDPRVGNDNASGRVGDLVHAALVNFTPDNDYSGDLAEKWDTPDDKTIIFHLRPNAKFQNGQPVRAADVKATYDSLLDPNFQSSKKSGYASVDHIEAPDDHTVVFKLKQPDGGIFANLNLGILPAGASADAYKLKPIGAGPYKVVDFKVDDRVELEAFDGYYGGAPKIKHVTIRIIPDLTTAVLELRRGTVNFEVNIIPFENVAEFDKNPDFKVDKRLGSVYQYLAFNLHDPILAKREVRQAIAHAIDRDKIAKDVMRGYAVPTDSMLMPGQWARAENLPAYPYDPAKAKQLLDQAGYRDPDGDGPQSRFKLVFKTSTDAEANTRAEVMQQMLKQVGIAVEIQQSELGTFLEDIGKGNFQLYSLSRNGIADPDFYYVLFYSKNFPPEGQNRGYYSNPRVDQLIMEGRSTFDKAKRKQSYAEIQKILQEDLPYLSLYHQYNVAIMRKNIEGYTGWPAGFLLSVPKMEIRK